MKLSCTQENLAKGLSIVSRSVGTRATLPVLNNILLQTDKGRLKLSATDLEIGIHTWVGAKIDAEGGITVPARLLIDFVNNNTDKNIELELKEQVLKISSDRFKANINGIEASEFPLIPQVKKSVEIELAKQELIGAINKTVIAAAMDESRPVLAGVYFFNQEQQMKVVATDSYRLAEQTITLINKPEKDFKFIVPQRTIAELGRILSSAGEKVRVLPGENQVEFVMEDTILVSRLIEGTFPDYAQIIPKESKTTMEVATAEFNNAIKMASLFARESANNIKLRITAPDKVEVLATSSHVGDNISTVTGVVKGDSLEVAFNAKFILDCLAVIGSERITLDLLNNMAAGVIRGNKDKNYLYVIMPLRIDE
ncbi:MAG: DNA polymerase III subunit beta [Candidatus Berkelbacteria bacterium]